MREGEEVVEFARGDQPADLGLVDRLVELVGRGGGEVADGTGRRRELEAVAGADFSRREAAGVDAAAAPALGSGIEVGYLGGFAGPVLEDPQITAAVRWLRTARPRAARTAPAGAVSADSRAPTA